MPTFCNFSSCYCLETDSWEIEMHHVNIGKFILLREQNIWWILLWEENWQIINLIWGFDIFNIKFLLHILLSFQDFFSFCCTIPLTFPLNLGLCKGFWGVVRKDDQLVHSEISNFIPPGTDCNCKKISNIYMFEINFPPDPFDAIYNDLGLIRFTASGVQVCPLARSYCFHYVWTWQSACLLLIWEFQLSEKRRFKIKQLQLRMFVIRKIKFKKKDWHRFNRYYNDRCILMKLKHLIKNDNKFDLPCIIFFFFVTATPAFHWPEWRSHILMLLSPALPPLLFFFFYFCSSSRF